VTKAQPQGVFAEPFNPVATAVATHAGFVSRSFAGMIEHMAEMIRKAIAHRGLSLVDILQPCPSFNKVNTWEWYRKRCYAIPKDHDASNWDAAMELAYEWGDRIPIGVIYRNDRTAFGDKFAILKEGPLVGREVDRHALAAIMESFA
jgi:2-oxoglutarate ferredoxin oxidoreductase subunit beta